MMSNYHSCVSISNTIGVVVPQRVYERTEQKFSPSPIISFAQYNHAVVSLGMAAQPEFCRGDLQRTGMVDWNVAADLRHLNSMVKIRIQWPGCQPYEQSINIVEQVSGELHSCSKVVLANKVANVVRRFRQEYVRSSAWDPQWAPGRYEFSQYVLHELRNVSMGVYQPVIVIIA